MGSHKVFVSFHHEDEQWRKRFENIMKNRMINCSVDIGDVDLTNNTETIRQTIRDNYIRDATVIVVLIGAKTWSRKHVDWEIYSALRDSKYNSRCGLLGILLPTYPLQNNGYDPHTVPPRLYKNVKNGFGRVIRWTENSADIEGHIDFAFQNKDKINPDLSDVLFAKNRTTERWE